MNDKRYTEIFREFKGVESDLIPLMIRIQEQDGFITKDIFIFARKTMAMLLQ